MTCIVGEIVNPVAGMGGKVGLKGTDGSKLFGGQGKLGAQSIAPQRVLQALGRLTEASEQITIIAPPGHMGEWKVRAAGLQVEALDMVVGDETTSADTVAAAEEILRKRVDLLLFGGGDGTARDIYNAVSDAVSVIGVPAGVKMHSAVFATDPWAAGDLALGFLRGEVRTVRKAEVMDIDEEAFRAGRVSAKLYGHLRVPQSQLR